MTKRTTKAGEVRYDVLLRASDGREVSRTFRTVKDAEKYEREQLRRRDRGEWIDPASGRVTLAEWSEEWQRTIVNLRPATLRIYADALRLYVLPELGAVQLGRLTTPQLRAWQVSDLADAVEPRYRAFVNVGAYCGLRLGELAALRWHRIDFLRRTISVVEQLNPDGARRGGDEVRPPKSSAGRRSVAVPRLVIATLEEHRAAGLGESVADGHVFVRPAGGGPIDVDVFRRRVWVPACRAAGVPGLRISAICAIPVRRWRSPPART